MRRLLNRASLSLATLAITATLITAPAAHAQKLGNFSVADTNHDGRITLQEFSTYETQRLMASNGFIAQRFKQMTPQEQASRLQGRFEKLDSGNKGYLDQNDWDGS